MQESLQLLSASGLVFDAIPINERQLDAVITTARRLPDLQIVINHLGRPPVPDQGWEPWATQVARASHCPNVSMKLSAGLDIVMRWKWSTEDIRRYVDHVLECFGPSRVMAASNWPVILLGGSYQDVWRGITELVGKLSAEKAAVLGGSERIYKLKSDPTGGTFSGLIGAVRRPSRRMPRGGGRIGRVARNARPSFETRPLGALLRMRSNVSRTWRNPPPRGAACAPPAPASRPGSARWRS